MKEEGLLEGEVLKQKDLKRFPKAPDKMHINKESVENIRNKLDLNERLKRIQRLCNEGIFTKNSDYKNEQFKDILRIVTATLNTTRPDIRRCLDKLESD